MHKNSTYTSALTRYKCINWYILFWVHKTNVLNWGIICCRKEAEWGETGTTVSVRARCDEWVHAFWVDSGKQQDRQESTNNSQTVLFSSAKHGCNQSNNDTKRLKSMYIFSCMGDRSFTLHIMNSKKQIIPGYIKLKIKLLKLIKDLITKFTLIHCLRFKEWTE